MNISDEPYKIIELYHMKKLCDYKPCDNNISLDILDRVIDMISNGSIDNHKNYKMEYYYDLFEFIVNKLLYIYNNFIEKRTEIINILKHELLTKLTSLYKGHVLLKRLSKIIHQELETIHKYLLIAAKNGTIGTFEFWVLLTEHQTFINLPMDLQEKVLINSIGNSDDRLYKVIINIMIQMNKLYLQQNPSVIKCMIHILAQSSVPDKYILRRLKLLSTYVSLIPYYSLMMLNFKEIKVLTEIHKYYYIVPYDFQLMYKLISKLYILGSINDMVSQFKFKTDDEYRMLNILLILSKSTKYININNDTSITDKFILDTINMNLGEVYNIIGRNPYFLNPPVHNLHKRIFNIMISNNIINNYLMNNKFPGKIDTFYLLFTRFVYINYNNKKLDKTNIAINFVLHRLRVLAKMKKKNKTIERNTKMFNLLSEIKTFEPNKHVKVLNSGSYSYQLSKQQFNNIPPRHLLPGELYFYKHFLLRDKADGILVSSLPVDIYPQCDTLNSYHIKAEYIEELDLYLVFDIDIPNTTIIERYNILRSCHPHTNMLEEVDTIDEFLSIFAKEQQNIKDFIDMNKKYNIKWYPKFACEFNVTNNNIYNDIIKNIKSSMLQPILYKCDGLILTPLNGEREIKIKPLDMMTIDLLYSNMKWYDRSMNDWSHIIKNSNHNIKSGCIYRCYPKNGYFEVGEYRYDKKQQNSTIIIETILNIINYNWNDTLYYGENKYILKDKQIIDYIVSHVKQLEQYIHKMNPKNNMKWLDLGCGKGKLVDIIKKYNVKYYLGLDNDRRQIVKAIKKHDKMQDVYNFLQCNLKEKWDSSYLLKNIKYDYIVANFSLMHFMNDMFWEQLNNITTGNSIFMFNVVSMKDNEKWQLSDSFMERKDNIVAYYFEWTHDKVMTEEYIDIMMIQTYLLKYGWKILDKMNYNMYDWYIIQQVG
jgi:SAM-dependent methyltransferase